MNPIDAPSSSNASPAPDDSEGFNPYSAPSAPVDVQAQDISDQWLYVVAPRKFLPLIVLTFGLYSICWF